MSKSGSRLLRAFSWYRDQGYRFDRARRDAANLFFGFVARQAYGKHVSFDGIEDFDAEAQPRWKHQDAARPKLTIVVVTYRQPVQLECLLASLCCQTLQNFEVFVIHDGADAETRAVAERFQQRSHRFSYHETPVRHNDYGHTLRAIGIKEAKTEYLLITNGDNYYAPRFTEFVFEAVESRSLDIAMWDIVHSYSSPKRATLRCYTPFRVFPVRYMLDIGAFLVRTSLAQRVGFADKSNAGDATYLEDILALRDVPIKLGKIEKALMVHN